MHGLAKIGIGFVSLLLLLGAAALVVAATPLFGNKALIVRSGSMEPTISVGDLVVARPQDEYRTDDVISFTAGSDNTTVITHRIVEVSESSTPRTYTTKGDANVKPDEFLVEEQNILGKQVVTVPYVGTVLAFAKTRLGFSLLVLIPTLFVVVGEGLAIYREMRHRKKEEVVETMEAVRPRRKNVVAPQTLLHRQVVQPSLRPHVKPMPAPSYRAYRPPAVTFTAARIRTSLDGASRRALLFFLMSCAVVGTWAVYSDTAQSTGNVFAAAEDFGGEETDANAVISEVQLRTVDVSTNDFIELYNPTGEAIDISSWKLLKQTAAGINAPQEIIVFPEATILEAHRFLLWANEGYSSVAADETSGATIAPDNSIALVMPDGGVVDGVGWGNLNGTQFTEGTKLGTLTSGKSFERKAFPNSDATSMAGGLHVDSGNGYDSDNNVADFIIRDTPESQHTGSATESP